MLTTTAVSGLIGLLTPFLSGLLKIWDRKNEFENQLQLRKLDFQILQKQAELGIKVEELKAYSEEAKALQQSETFYRVPEWVDVLRALVRPIIAYSFFIMFVIVKLSTLIQIMSMGVSLSESLVTVWGEKETAIMAIIVGYYFGSRLTEKFLISKSNE